MRTYESYLAEARDRSKGCYAAVVTITNYRSGTTRTCVMVGKTPIETRTVGPEFIGVDAMFHDGLPEGDPVPVTVLLAAEGEFDDLPF